MKAYTCKGLQNYVFKLFSLYPFFNFHQATAAIQGPVVELYVIFDLLLYGMQVCSSPLILK